MPQHVKRGNFLQAVQCLPKCLPVHFTICLSFKNFSVIWIHPLHKMKRTDHKIKRIFPGQLLIRVSKVRLQAKFYSYSHIQFPSVLFPDLCQHFKIFFQIKLKRFRPQFFVFRIIQIQMICNADCPKPPLHGSIQHTFDRRLTVCRKIRMHMVITPYH